MKCKFIGLAVSLLMILTLVGCTKSGGEGLETGENNQGNVYLYGEAHGVPVILNKEFETWKNYYDQEKMRHLFIELPYYTAEYLNIWMKADNNEILEEIFKDTEGTQGATETNKNFFKRIKKECPETIFHGTDVGHQYDTTGVRFLGYLKSHNLENTESYKLTVEAIDQGKTFYKNVDHIYRENTLVHNFMREFNQLKSESVMGIYGAAHTGLDQLDNTGKVPCMANQLSKVYGKRIKSTDLTQLTLMAKPLSTEKMEILGKTYLASYFGEYDIKGIEGLSSRKFWRLENAYKDFKDHSAVNDALPYSNYPMVVEIGQIFVIEYTKTDGSKVLTYYRSDGDKWQGLDTTVGFKLQ